MNRKLLLVVIILVLVAMPATVIFAGTYRSPNQDIVCEVEGNCYDDQGLTIGTDDSSGECKIVQVMYLGWSGKDIPDSPQWESASLEITAYAKAINEEKPPTFEVYKVLAEWDENTTRDPGYSDSLLASTVDNLKDNKVRFESKELGNYFWERREDKEATVAVVIKDCNNKATFVDHEGSDKQDAVNDEADLMFHVATSVSLSHVDKESSNFSWFALAAIVALIVFVSGILLRKIKTA